MMSVLGQTRRTITRYMERGRAPHLLPVFFLTSSTHPHLIYRCPPLPLLLPPPSSPSLHIPTMVAKPSNLQHTNHSYYLLLLLFLLAAAPTSAQTQLEKKTINMGPFQSSDAGTLLSINGSSGIANGALQLTPDSINTMNPYFQNKTGRILFRQPFRLWENSGNTTRVASFNSTFVVNIFRGNNTVVGEGLSFLIAPALGDPPPGSDHGYLGLTNLTTDGNASNHIVAVELDTYKQPYDPDDNHIGLNINSVRSIATTSLNRSGIVLSPVNPANYTVWVEYNGQSRSIAVYMAREGTPKPSSPVLAKGDLDLSKYVLQDSYLGFSGSTGDVYQLNCVLFWNLTVEVIPMPKKDDHTLILATAIGLPLLFVVVLVAAAGGLYWRKRKARDDGLMLGDKLKSLPGMPREFKYGELKKATNNFSEKNKLGQGGFGVVYRGKMEADVGEFAVKTFSKESRMDDFLQELTIINRLRHRHLVRLLGWCYRKGKLLLVYEFMPNGGLDSHLYNSQADSTLPWALRFSILAGVASALNYLHNEYEQKVVHRDLKASNILLDSQFNARLGDFGLARTIDPDRTSYAEAELDGMPGTIGYIAPECFHTGKATRESDVFGFGAVVLEVVCCRRPAAFIGQYRSLVDWVWMLYREGRILEAVDEKLNGAYDEVEAERLLMLGLACCHPIAGERPKTQAIVQMISGSVPLPDVPQLKPAFVWPGTMDVGFDDRMMSIAMNSSAGNFSYSTVGTSTLYGVGSAGGWTTPSPGRDGDLV